MSSKDNQLFFSPFPSFFLKVPMLDNQDKVILLHILDSYDETLSISIEELSFLTSSGKRTVTTSIQKLCFMEVIVKQNTITSKGHNGTPKYRYNTNRDQWRLTTQTRELLNKIEHEKNIQKSTGIKDIMETATWFLRFERTLHPLQKHFFDENDNEIKTRKLSITNFSMKWHDYLNRLLGKNRPVMSSENVTLKRLENIIENDSI